MNCYLSRNYRSTDAAGNKAKTDIERIMREMGFANVGLRQTAYRNVVVAFFATLAGVVKAPFCLHRGDVLFLQYPLKKYFAFVCRMAHLRGAKVVTVIHDLGSFRRQKLTVRQEIHRLNHADYVIAHNDSMKQWLEQHGCRSLLGTLKIFDYLSDTVSTATTKAQEQLYSIVYAGGLSSRKNSFLYDWIDEVGQSGGAYHIHLYGMGFETNKVRQGYHMQYMGFVKSDELIATAHGDFGLVWDGQSMDSCKGDWGEYLRYNNPHKTSLYLRCGLPVIIWSKAALADFVTCRHAGLCVDSLHQLNDTLASLTRAEYDTMRRNAERISEQLASGHYFQEATAEALTVLTGAEPVRVV